MFRITRCSTLTFTTFMRHDTKNIEKAMAQIAIKVTQTGCTMPFTCPCDKFRSSFKPIYTFAGDLVFLWNLSSKLS